MNRPVIRLVISLAGMLILPCCGTLDSEGGFDLEGMTEPPQRTVLPPAPADQAATIPFEGTSWRLPRSADSALDAVAERLRSGTGRVILTGGADGGDDEYSRQLGQQRAGEVAAALEKRGIAKDRIVTLSRGAAIGGRRTDRVDLSIVGQ